MPNFTLTHTDDPLGLATAGDIVLTEARVTESYDLVDILSESAIPLSNSAKRTRGIKTATVGYELRDSALVLPLGVNVGANGYRISAIRATCSAEGYPTVNVTAVKPIDGSFADTPGAYGNIEIPGGFGVVSTFGATCSAATEATLTISSQQALAVSGTSGKIMTLGMVLYAYRKEASISGYSPITIPVGGVETSSDENKSRANWATYAKSWQEYLIPAS